MKDKQKELAYYLTLYTLKGHDTWRCDLDKSKDGFALKQEKNWPKHVKVEKKLVIRIDRLTGQIQPLE